MTRPTRVLVSGYYGFGNTGDEAILAGLVEGFRQLAPAVELVVLSADSAATESEHGVRAVARGLPSAARHLSRCDLLLSGGGGLIQDQTSSRSPLYYLGLIRLAGARGKPVACVGHGIGPLHGLLARNLTRSVLSTAAVLAVRDQQSRDLLEEIGLRRPVEVTADLAFLLPPPTAEEVESAWQEVGLTPDLRPAAAVALRRPVGHEEPELASALGQALGSACEEIGLRPVLLPMHYPRDLAFAERVAQSLGRPHEMVRCYLPARRALALIGGFAMMIAMRLHALALAAVCGVPPVAVSYDPKVEAVMGELGLGTAARADAFDPASLAVGIREAWGARASAADMLRERVARLRAAALRNVELVIPLLSRPG
jgi:polysaccharide pyruvyl transferase CsaB